MYCDPLTGLAQRAMLVERLAALLRVGGQTERLGVCCVDLDRFEAINDRLGRPAGDEVLVHIADRIREIADRAGHLVARLESDKFAVLLIGTAGVDEVERLASAVLDVISEPFQLHGVPINLTASAGIVESTTARLDPRATTCHQDAAYFLDAADSALHWAKADGRARYCVYTRERDIDETERLELVAALPTAIRADEIVLYYQPLVALRSPSTIIGFEALVRWQHPRHGLLGPDKFIGLAQRYGHMTELGTHVLRQACATASRWLEIGGARPYVSVNVAAEQLADPEFVRVVQSTLDLTGLAPHRLQLELTEHATIQTDPGTRSRLRQLADSGVRLAIDDFGTGYSNLSVLAQLPLHGLKLD